MPIPRSRLRLDPDDLDELLGQQRECHVATSGPDGSPHVAPLWFVWHGGALWTNSLIKSRRTRDLRSGSQVAVCVNDGREYAELRGAILRGAFIEAAEDPALVGARRLYNDKYWGGAEVPSLASHVWLKLVPASVASWDFRKIPSGRDKKIEARDQAATDGLDPS